MKKYIIFLLPLFILTACGPLKIAYEAFQQDDLETTIAECKIVIQNDSTNAAAYELLGDAFSRQGKIDSAVTAWKAAFQFADAKDNLADKLSLAFVALADSQIVHKKYRNALELLDTGLHYTPQAVEIIEKKGDVLRLYKRPDQAYEQYELALQTGADSLQLYSKLSELDSLQQEAERALSQGLKLLNDRQYKPAIKYFNQAVELKPDMKSARYYLHMAKGRYNYKRGSVKELWQAVDEFGHAANFAPEKGAPFYWMGLTYHKKDKDEYENAIEQLEYAAQLEPEGEYAKAALKKAQELRAHREKMRKFWGK